MSYRWKDIRDKRQCPICGHGIRFHRYLKQMSELIDADIWDCQTCKTKKQFCSSGGAVTTRPPGKPPKPKDPFE